MGIVCLVYGFWFFFFFLRGSNKFCDCERGGGTVRQDFGIYSNQLLKSFKCIVPYLPYLPYLTHLTYLTLL